VTQNGTWTYTLNGLAPSVAVAEVGKLPSAGTGSPSGRVLGTHSSVRVGEDDQVIDAVELFLQDSGPLDGCPVLLLHGGSSSAATWARLTASLPERRVIAPDLRGHGSSPRCASYPLDGYVADVVAALDRLRLDRAAVVGHSLGGYVAARLAMEQPQRVTRLVLEEPPVPPRSAPRPASRLDIVKLTVVVPFLSG
jgi:pimeloyl-ACP methyl ester carboxylesterase